MMNKGLLYSVCIIAGGGLVAHGVTRMPLSLFKRDTNFLELKGSAFGALIGKALQDPVHNIHHGGVTHSHHGEEGDCHGACEGHDHDHEHSVDLNEIAEGKSLLVGLKLRMNAMQYLTRQNHSPVERGLAVKNFEDKLVADLTELAYEMDPTNFGNYNNWSYFLRTSSFYENGKEKAYQVAETTIQQCDRYPDSPEAQLTAASAAESVLVWRSQGAKHSEYWTLREDYDLYQERVLLFENALNGAIEDGRIKFMSQARFFEVEKRYESFAYTLREYLKLIQQSELYKEQQEGQ